MIQHVVTVLILTLEEIILNVLLLARLEDIILIFISKEWINVRTINLKTDEEKRWKLEIDGKRLHNISETFIQ